MASGPLYDHEIAYERARDAGPDLLAAAKRADQFLDHLRNSFAGGVCQHTQAMMDGLKAAISNAEGRT